LFSTVFFVCTCFLSTVNAEPNTDHARIALFQPAAEKSDATLEAALGTVADSIQLSLVVLDKYDIARLPPADPVQDIAGIRAYCEENRIDQAIAGSGSRQKGGGMPFGWWSMTGGRTPSPSTSEGSPAARWTCSM
jgi:hypothetical protein